MFAAIGASFTARDVALLAAAVGVPFPEEDLAPLADALTAHAAAVEPLLRAVGGGETPWLVPDPRWHG